MLIGIDASRANEINKTGTERYAYNLIQNFKNICDPKDRFILYTKEPLRDELGILPKNFRCRVLKWPPRFLWTQIRLSLEMLMRPPDVLFVPAHTIPFIHPKKTVTTLHDVGFEKYKELYSLDNIGYKIKYMKLLINIAVRIITLGKYGSNEYDYHRFSARFAVKHAYKIITISKFTKSEIIKYYGKAKSENIIVIPISHEEEIADINYPIGLTQGLLDKYGIKKPYLLYIGRLEEKKNTGGLVEAFNLLVNKHKFTGQLVLLGKAGYNFEMILKIIERNGLENKIIMPGWINENERKVILKESMLFVFPSFYEGFGIPPLEAMAAGVPVVASNVASMPEVLGDAAYLVNPYDVENIVDGVMKLINNDGLADKLIKKGYDRIKKYSWEKTSIETLKTLRI